jgi:predicted nuclease with TOPRIM domain
VAGEHGDPAVAAPGNGESSRAEREELATVLQQEQDDRADFREALTERDDRIDELESLLSQVRDEMTAKQESLDEAQAEAAALREARQEALFGCRDALRLAHPELPPDLIRGGTVEELAASVESAKALVDQVRAALQAEKAAVRIPAGAPVDSGPDLSGLSSRDKIAAGVQHASKR